jgi:hypothetical protein
MATRSDALLREFAHHRELTLTVTGRKSGRAISIPVWFAVQGERLYLLPVTGSDTQGYRNVLQDPRVHLRAGGTELDCTLRPILKPAQLSFITEQFRARYGGGGMKYYSKLDAAAVVEPG